MSVSFTSTGVWAMMGPPSRSSVTQWTVQPETLTPASRAWRWACRPLNEGSREGWMLSIFP